MDAKQYGKLTDELLDLFHNHDCTVEEFGYAFASVVHTLGLTDGAAQQAADDEWDAQQKKTKKRAAKAGGK